MLRTGSSTALPNRRTMCSSDTRRGWRARRRQYPAVTITVAKRKGTNATDIANAVLQRVHRDAGRHCAQRRDHHHNAQLRRDREGQV